MRNEDVLDVRDLIKRFEELEAYRESYLSEFDEENIEVRRQHWAESTDEGQEYGALEALLEELKGSGGDEEWRGDWYPVTLIHDDYFEDYVEEFIKDCGYIAQDLPSWIAIDWKETAEICKIDYTAVSYNGYTYYYR